MGAASYTIERCSTCGMSFNVAKGSAAANRVPFVCDADWEDWLQRNPRPSFDIRQGAMAPVSGIPAENVVVSPTGQPERPELPSPESQSITGPLLPSFASLASHFAPDGAAANAADAQQRAAADAAPTSPVFPDRSPGVDQHLAMMAEHSQPSDDRHSPVENVVKGDTEPAETAEHVAAGQAGAQKDEAE